MTESSKMKQQKISDWNFLGINIYNKERLSEETLEIVWDKKIEFDYIGLNCIVKDQAFEYTNFFDTHNDWSAYARTTLYLTIMSLVLNEQIGIVQFMDRKSMLSNLIKKTKVGYYLTRNQYEAVADPLSSIILDAVSMIQKKGIKKRTLEELVHVVIDHYLGRSEEHSYPNKVFMTRLFKQYDEAIDWFHIHVKKKYLGLSKKYEVFIDDEQLPSLMRGHHNFESELSFLEDYNKSLLPFKEALQKSIMKDFASRRPSDSGSSDGD